jgi:hypothetical protein
MKMKELTASCSASAIDVHRALEPGLLDSTTKHVRLSSLQNGAQARRAKAQRPPRHPRYPEPDAPPPPERAGAGRKSPAVSARGVGPGLIETQVDADSSSRSLHRGRRRA